MERSYFIYKQNIKNKIKQLERYEKVLVKLEVCPNHENLVQNIKYLKKYISEMKKEINEDINLIYHG